MASPTAGELETQLKNAVDFLEDTKTGLIASAATLVDTYLQSIESDFDQAATNSAYLFRSRAASALGAASAVLEPILVAYAHHIVLTPERDVQTVISRIYDYFVTNSKTIKSRGITFNDPVAAGTNTGSGAIYRLTKDESNYDLEACFMEVKTLKVVSDAQSGALLHEEIFEVRGQNRGLDAITIAGSGLLRRDAQCRTSNQSLLSNPSFSSYSATAPTAGVPSTFGASDTLTDWTVSAGAITSLQLDIDITARDTVGDTTPTAVRWLGNAAITQTFETANATLDPATPYYLEMWVYREGNATGTLTVTMGSQTQAFTIGSLSNAAWNRCRLSLDRDLWPSRFNAANAGITLAVTSLATSTILIDEVVLCPFYSFDGTWLTISPASGTGANDFLLDDSFTITDALAGSDSKIQQWLWRAYGRYLPHAGSPTITDP